jgi:hypothetical protein
MAHQLCLNLGDIEIKTGGRNTRPIPDIVFELFELSDKAPSGLVHRNNTPNGRKAGEPAGSKMGKTSYYLVSVRGHGVFYAHRIAYYLIHKEDPGTMVVRHLFDKTLALGFQTDNLKDEKGKHKKIETGYTTKKMYEYKGSVFNLTKLCKLLNLKYSTIQQKISKTADPKTVFEELGHPCVNPLY